MLKMCLAKGARHVLLSLIPVILMACGGGAGDTPPPPPSPPPTIPPTAPVVSLGFGIKQLQFSWPAVSGATHYRLFENPDGASGFSQVGSDLSTPAVNLDIAVHQHDWANARYLVEACNSLGCTPSNEVTTIAGDALAAIGYFKASNSDQEDKLTFYDALALSGDGNTLAVGSAFEASAATGINNTNPGQADNSQTNVGAVYVFARVSGAWVQQAYIKASNAEALDSFGSSVALSDDGNTLVVGARGEDSGATGSFDTSNGVVGAEQTDNSQFAAGAVYVFTRSGTTWTQRSYIKASNPEFADSFGAAIALSGDGQTLAVGAPGEDSAATGINDTVIGQADNSQIQSGAVYVFARSGDLWTQQAYVKSSSPGIRLNHDFGGVVALSTNGNTLAVGAYKEESAATGVNGDQNADCPQPSPVNCALGSGAVYVFVRTGTDWAQEAFIKASNTGADDGFGLTLALSGDGDTLAVGAYREDSAATQNFDLASGQGTAEQADDSATDAGAVYVYVRSGGAWVPQTYIKATNAEAEDFFGGTVALSADGNILAVGATNEDADLQGVFDSAPTVPDSSAVRRSGAVYLYTRSGGLWNQYRYLKASNESAFDFFGGSIRLSLDGSTIAVGATGEDSDADGINGDQGDNSVSSAGAVYLY